MKTQEVVEFINKVARDVALRTGVVPSAYDQTEIAAGDEETFIAATLQDAIRQRRKAKARRSQGRDSANAAEREVTLQSADPQREDPRENEYELTSKDRAILDQVVREGRRGGPLNEPESVSKNAGRTGRSYTPDYFLGVKPDAPATELYERIAKIGTQQRDNSTLDQRIALVKYFGTLPRDARVRGCDEKVLRNLVGALIRNKNSN